MWWVFCGTNDLSALWAARGLKALGLEPLEIVTSESLTYNRRLEHRVRTGSSNVIIELADGRVLESRAVRGVLNRLGLLPSAHFDAANTVDRDYAQQELYALFLSWLHSLPGPLLNRPTPQGLSGAWRHLSEWMWLAGKAGLMTPPYRLGGLGESYDGGRDSIISNRMAIVTDDVTCEPAMPPQVRAGCLALARLSGTALLGIHFHVANGQWTFVSATPAPDLHLGGDPVLHGLYRQLTQ
ncbi:MAG TPA: hypothetical protein VIB79_06760 [Candidatus Binatia bacterium]|jgi:hypothetical protein